ncbi:hypothetical protein KUTeg_007602 [Tegillarca granosa]|uniref:Uncharacterized protein n=1 Tax=Tegillarca granosa TaxID=220873 RepID=A0ABQ9FFZ9_TEGGR|nr:hypothetical protein KUTeg_007602 [Tegillarca granosa]
MSGDKRKKSTGILSFFKPVSRELTESERGESVSDIDEHETHESFEAVSSKASAAKVIKPKKRSFQEAWKSDFSWLVYDETSDTMYCDVCKKAGPEIARVSLYKQVTNEESRHLTESGSHMTPSPTQDVRTELLGVVRNLTTTVQNLQSSMISLTERVNNMSRPQPTLPAAAGSADQLRQTAVQNTMERVDVVCGTLRETRNTENYTRNTENYTLSTAWADQNSTKTMGVKTTYGYLAESLPYVETISPNLRKQIIEGKDVNLATILIPYYTGPDVDKDKSDKERKDPRLNKTLTITEFIQAFGIYKSTLCEAFPRHRQELDLYERDIIDMATRYGGTAF